MLFDKMSAYKQFNCFVMSNCDEKYILCIHFVYFKLALHVFVTVLL